MEFFVLLRLSRLLITSVHEFSFSWFKRMRIHGIPWKLIKQTFSLNLYTSFLCLMLCSLDFLIVCVENIKDVNEVFICTQWTWKISNPCLSTSTRGVVIDLYCAWYVLSFMKKWSLYRISHKLIRILLRVSLWRENCSVLFWDFDLQIHWN